VRYSVVVDTQVRKKDLAGVPRRELQRIVKRISDLADNPTPPGSEKLTGRARYRVRQGVYRVLYEIDDHGLRVTVRKVAHRRDADR
jgi:mRNA interferase RelE/StbE